MSPASTAVLRSDRLALTPLRSADAAEMVPVLSDRDSTALPEEGPQASPTSRRSTSFRSPARRPATRRGTTGSSGPTTQERRSASSRPPSRGVRPMSPGSSGSSGRAGASRRRRPAQCANGSQLKESARSRLTSTRGTSRHRGSPLHSGCTPPGRSTARAKWCGSRLRNPGRSVLSTRARPQSMPCTISVACANSGAMRAFSSSLRSTDNACDSELVAVALSPVRTASSVR